MEYFADMYAYYMFEHWKKTLIKRNGFIFFGFDFFSDFLSTFDNLNDNGRSPS